MTFATKQNADSCETSIEIMTAIQAIARSDEEAQRIWEAPTEPEMIAIWEAVTKNGLNAADEYYWGAEGNRWAKTIKA